MISSGGKQHDLPISSDLFVGRSRPLEMMKGAVDQALGGRGGLVLVSGEAGIGKTRLAEEAATYAASRNTGVLWTSCWKGHGSPPFLPWIQVLRRYQETQGRPALIEDLGKGAPDVLSIMQELHGGVPNRERDGDPEQVRFRMFDSFTSFFVTATLRQPLLVVVDDMHLADAGSLALLRFMVPRLRTARGVVVATYREPDAGSDSMPTQLFLETRATSVALSGLRREELGQLLAGLSRDPANARLVDWMHAQTAGNPYFAKELFRLLRSRGLADAQEPMERLPVPDSITHLLRGRLAMLPAQTTDMLAQAAVLGHEFDLNTLQALSDLERHALLAMLKDAIRAWLLVPGDRSDRYAFVHTLMREVLYDGLPEGRRSALHLLAGQILERRASGENSDVDQIAEHFLRAGPDGDPERAVRYAQQAGQSAIRRLGYDEAASYFRRALDAPRGFNDRSRRLELLLQLGDANVRAGYWSGALEAFEAAAREATELGRPRDLARAALGMGARLQGFEVRLYDRRQIELLNTALAELGEADTNLTAKLLARLSVALTFVEPLGRRRELSQQAEEAAERGGDASARAYAYAATCDAFAGPAHVDLRLSHAAASARLAEQADDLDLQMLARRLRVVALLESGDIQGADAEVDTFAAIAEELRLPLYLWCVPLWRGMRALMQGRLDNCEGLNSEAQAIGKKANSDNAAMLVQSQRLCMLLEAGQTEEALALCEREFRPARFPAAWPWMTKLLAGTGRTIEARGLLDRLVSSDFTDIPDDAQWLGCFTSIAEACSILHAAPAAEVTYRALAPHAYRFALTGTAAACFGSVSRHLGLLAHVLGRWDEAEAHFQDAIRDNRRAGAPLLVAHALRSYAAMLFDRGHGDAAKRAIDLAREALTIYRGLHLQHWVDTTREPRQRPACDRIAQYLPPRRRCLDRRLRRDFDSDKGLERAARHRAAPRPARRRDARPRPHRSRGATGSRSCAS
jgi:eukaryotic-like serine/threonine-protein kinase